MAKLIARNEYNGEIIIINLGELAVKQLEEEYDGDVEEWFSGEGYEAKFKVCLNFCTLMFIKDESRIKEYNI